MTQSGYIHGYSDREALRLNDQADTLDNIIHNDTIFSKDSLVLEAGCGVGAQTIGLSDISVSPLMVYVDASKPQLVEGFIKNTFTAMIEGVGEKAIKQGIVNRSNFLKGIKDLYRTAEPDGVFSYTFYKGFGIKK
jgi:SAM-dependent methyltransferase